MSLSSFYIRLHSLPPLHTHTRTLCQNPGPRIASILPGCLLSCICHLTEHTYFRENGAGLALTSVWRRQRDGCGTFHLSSFTGMMCKYKSWKRTHSRAHTHTLTKTAITRKAVQSKFNHLLKQNKSFIHPFRKCCV